MSKRSEDNSIKSAWDSYSKGDYDRAYELFNKMFESGKDKEALYGRACTLFRMADHEGALADLNEMAGSGSADPVIYHTRAHVYGADEQYDKALKDLKKVLSLEPENAEAWCDLGGLYLITDELLEAGRCFEKTADLEKSCACGWLGKGITALLSKEGKKAEEYLNIALKLDKKNTLAYMARAEQALLNNNSKDALKDIKKLFSLDDDFKQRFIEQLNNETDGSFDEKDIV